MKLAMPFREAAPDHLRAATLNRMIQSVGAVHVGIVIVYGGVMSLSFVAHAGAGGGFLADFAFCTVACGMFLVAFRNADMEDLECSHCARLLQYPRHRTAAGRPIWACRVTRMNSAGALLTAHRCGREASMRLSAVDSALRAMIRNLRWSVSRLRTGRARQSRPWATCIRANCRSC